MWEHSLVVIVIATTWIVIANVTRIAIIDVVIGIAMITHSRPTPLYVIHPVHIVSITDGSHGSSWIITITTQHYPNTITLLFYPMSTPTSK